MGAQSRKLPRLDAVFLSVQSDAAAGGRGPLWLDSLRTTDGGAGDWSDARRCAGFASGPGVRGDARMEGADGARHRALKSRPFGGKLSPTGRTTRRPRDRSLLGPIPC